jgi:hypothetical protein
MAERNYSEPLFAADGTACFTVSTKKTFFQPFSLLQHCTGGCKEIRS